MPTSGWGLFGTMMTQFWLILEIYVTHPQGPIMSKKGHLDQKIAISISVNIKLTSTIMIQFWLILEIWDLFSQNERQVASELKEIWLIEHFKN